MSVIDGIIPDLEAIISAMRWHCRSKAIWFLAAYLLLTALQGCSISSAVSISTQVATDSVPLIEAIPNPTASLSPTPLDSQLILSPQPIQTDIPESTKDTDRLVSAAKYFTAETPEQVKLVLDRIGEADASNIDGPLALAILQQAGVLDQNINPHRFWLLDPMADTKAMERVFPRENYSWRRLDGVINVIDYAVEKLLPADFLYLIPVNSKIIGKSLVVTRIDQAGRVFSTTNIYDPQSGEFSIKEIVLFDPNQKSSGFFGAQASMYRGFLMVRKRDYDGQPPEQIALEKVLNRGGIWQVVVRPVGGEKVFSLNEDEIVHPASIIKVPLAMLVMKNLLSGTNDLQEAMQSAPPEAGRTYEQLLRAMLVLSEETATDILEKDLRAKLGDKQIRDVLDAWGAVHTTLEPRRSTAAEITHLWDGLYNNRLLGEQASTILLNYLAEVTPGDSVRIWKLAEKLPDDARIFNKRGSLTQPMVVADSGIIVLPDGRAYILCLIGEPDDWTGFEDLDKTIGDFAITWYQQLDLAAATP